MLVGAKLCRVLVVDDALFMRTLIREVLESSGRYEVIGEASTGAEAVAQFDESRPDLVTLDLIMPGMNGIDACREIMRLDPEARVVMCSAVGQESLVMEAIEAGARDFIVKPFSTESVLEALDRLALGGDR